MRGLLIGILSAARLAHRGAAAARPKFVLVGAPHTSNWDFALFLGATDELGIRPSYLGKHSLFRWPLRRFMRDMGGIPVDRTKRANYVEQVVAEFAAATSSRWSLRPKARAHSDGQVEIGLLPYRDWRGRADRPGLDRPQRRIEPIGPAIRPAAIIAPICAASPTFPCAG